MTNPISFLNPHMVGERFSGHAIPLEVLKDLAVLEEMVVEVAKWHYLKDHPNRKRSPRGFTDGISLKLTEVADGSASAKIGMFLTLPVGLFPNDDQAYFEKSRDSIVAAISAAEHGESITDHLTGIHLAYFDRIGRSLRDDESIEFDHENQSRPARLNKATRRKLTLASSSMQEFTEEVVLRGAIPEADQRKLHFELELISGQRVRAPWESQHRETVIEAFKCYRDGMRVSLHGIAKFNRSERLQSIESVEHISILESTDVAARLDEFRLLRNGWLDGNGLAPSEEQLDWLTHCLESLYPDELPDPYLYPTAEGGVQVEWSLPEHEISLEVSLDRRQGEWQNLDNETHVVDDQELDLDDQKNWQWIAEEIRARKGTGL